ncbi:MAG: hypothetical protein JSV88_26905 [Candidatus Aminicenantes bacterium]|nr:MAG: hypothetical protein JSV88_26905 [Candidatus Aminicenantes bacterium]
MKKIFVYGMVILPLVVVLSFPGNTFAGESGKSNYVLVFQATDYNSKLGQAVEYFFKQILRPEDDVILFTPQRFYNYSQQTRQAHPLDKLTKRTKDVLKRDISVGAANYNNTIEQMQMIVTEIGKSMGTVGAGPGSGGEGMRGMTSVTDLKNWLIQYRQLLENLRTIRRLNEKLFMDLAQSFKQRGGNNIIFVFYQQEMRITPDKDTMDALRNNPDIRFEATEVFSEENIKEPMDAAKVSQALKDAGVTLHFVYMHKRMSRRQGIETKEFSGDIYNVFSKITQNTGGQVMTTAKPDAALKKILGAKKKK